MTLFPEIGMFVCANYVAPINNENKHSKPVEQLLNVIKTLNPLFIYDTNDDEIHFVRKHFPGILMANVTVTDFETKTIHMTQQTFDTIFPSPGKLLEGKIIFLNNSQFEKFRQMKQSSHMNTAIISIKITKINKKDLANFIELKASTFSCYAQDKLFAKL